MAHRFVFFSCKPRICLTAPPCHQTLRHSPMPPLEAAFFPQEGSCCPWAPVCSLDKRRQKGQGTKGTALHSDCKFGLIGQDLVIPAKKDGWELGGEECVSSSKQNGELVGKEMGKQMLSKWLYYQSKSHSNKRYLPF